MCVCVGYMCTGSVCVGCMCTGSVCEGGMCTGSVCVRCMCTGSVCVGGMYLLPVPQWPDRCPDTGTLAVITKIH